MAHRSTHPVNVVLDSCEVICMKLVGGGAATDMSTPVNPGPNDCVLADYTATGKFTLTFRHSYPGLIGVAFGTVGTTDGLRGQFASIDVVAKTAALELYVGNTATDPATTDTIYVWLFVRNSGRQS